MTPLADHLRRRIALNGPMTVAEFMAAAMSHPRWGYYMRADPLGREGDFITAPEVSQMFGELLGLWCVDAWDGMGRPAAAALVELGPGRGTLMADALRAIAAVPECRAALAVHMVETSPLLRAAQATALEGAGIAWHDTLRDVPEGPMLLLANELFDALPIHQFERTLAGWRERLVDAAGDGFRTVLAPGSTPAAALIPPTANGAPVGGVVELCPAAISLAHEIGRRVAGFGGAALIVDYGTDRGPFGDTLQAVRRHGFHEVLADPGAADLSARVDFAALGRAVEEAGAVAFGPANQGDFLLALGIETRAAALKRKASAAQAADIDAALHRLVDPGMMGTLFQVMAVAPRGAQAPAGFESC